MALGLRGKPAMPSAAIADGLRGKVFKDSDRTAKLVTNGRFLAGRTI